MTDIIFVCAWNTCRSAMAQYIMQHLLDTAGLADKIHVDSAGCITEGGEPLGRRTRQTLLDNGISVSAHVSKSFTTQHYQTFDRVIALDKGVLRLLKKNFDGDPDDKISLLTGDDGKPLSVEDPGYKGEHAKAYAEILRGCQVLLNEIA